MIDYSWKLLSMHIYLQTARNKKQQFFALIYFFILLISYNQLSININSVSWKFTFNLVDVMAGATALAMSFGWPGYLADRVSIYIKTKMTLINIIMMHSQSGIILHKRNIVRTNSSWKHFKIYPAYNKVFNRCSDRNLHVKLEIITDPTDQPKDSRAL